MTAIEPAMNYVPGDTPALPDKVYLHYNAVANEIFVSAQSETGRCFYLHEINGSGVRFRHLSRVRRGHRAGVRSHLVRTAAQPR